MTRRTRGISLQQLIEDLTPYLIGWRGYFGFCQTPRVLTNLEAWIRRRLRSYLWRQWRNGRNRFNELRRRGVSSGRRRFTDGALAHGRTPGGPTGPAQPLLQLTRSPPTLCLCSSLTRYALFKLNPVEPPWSGPVCPVVGEGRHREVSPYPDIWRQA